LNNKRNKLKVQRMQLIKLQLLLRRMREKRKNNKKKFNNNTRHLKEGLRVMEKMEHS